MWTFARSSDVSPGAARGQDCPPHLIKGAKKKMGKLLRDEEELNSKGKTSVMSCETFCCETSLLFLFKDLNVPHTVKNVYFLVSKLFTG